MPAFIDPIGKKFGRLTVTSYDGASVQARLAGDASNHDGCADHISGALLAFGDLGAIIRSY
jgi:ethanolamine utilization microcompartment shell protein EutS